MTAVTRRRLRIHADLDRIAEVRTAIREVAEGCNAPEACENDLVQAVDEAATNAIVHGYRGADGWLEVTAERVDDHIVITIEDTAPTFDPTTVVEPDLSIPPARRRPGGMGVHLIRLATDSMTHRPRPGGGNILTLTRRLSDETGNQQAREGSTMALDTTVEDVEGRVPITVLALRGELDASNFQTLVAEVQGLYGAGTRHLLLDLAELTFMASSGLIALHSIVRVLQGDSPVDPESGWGAIHEVGHDVAGGSTQTAVQLCGSQPPVQRVLDRTGMSRLFVVHPDRATAIAAF